MCPIIYRRNNIFIDNENQKKILGATKVIIHSGVAVNVNVLKL